MTGTGGGGRRRGGGASLLALLPAGVVDGMVVVLGRIVAGGVRGSVEAKGRSDAWGKGEPLLQLRFSGARLRPRNAGTEMSENKVGEFGAYALVGAAGPTGQKTRNKQF